LRVAPHDTSTIQSICTMLERQVGQMVRLVDDLLDVSRISRDRVELQTAQVDLGSVIGQAVDSIRPIAASLGHELLVSLPPEPMLLDGDAARLTQVFANLLDNACKYTDKGGRISLTAEAHQTDPGRPGEVVVRVSDTGIGIPADHLTRIFDMFTQ